MCVQDRARYPCLVNNSNLINKIPRTDNSASDSADYSPVRIGRRFRVSSLRAAAKSQG